MLPGIETVNLGPNAGTVSVGIEKGDRADAAFAIFQSGGKVIYIFGDGIDGATTCNNDTI
ncbi:hypothetical protein DSCW_32980 [Desulfosarcina widdelii]|uniref:Uncharacterized protein n=1 Tax=Desulfosarcina widdelii TaxID=947919 RepID=A0A5K7Z864_9BACT|nr:hypothetical protein DSCW_32980 [Desulfosarcina widdelii]